MIRGYRTTSYAVATALAGIPPLELLTRMYAYTYRRIRELREANTNAPPRAARLVKLQARRRMLEEWLTDQMRTVDPWTQQVVAAIQPRLAEWLERGRDGIPFRTTQILTGHGCFGAFLCRIGRDRTTECHYCGAPDDTAWHTLAECQAWERERRAMVAAVGRNLSLLALIDALMGDGGTRRAVIHFCEKVISQKEDHERTRRHEDGGVRRKGRWRGDGARYRPPKPRAHVRPI